MKEYYDINRLIGESNKPFYQKEPKYLVYVKQFSMIDGGYITIVYYTDLNPLFVMGEIMFRTLEDIKSINYSKFSRKKLSFWIEEKARIYEFHSKYWGKEL